MRKIFTIFIALLMSIGLGTLPMVVQAQTIWNGSADISWYDASQTSFDIYTPEELAGIAQLVNNGTTNFSGKVINLRSDIWLNALSDSTNNWTTIGGDPTASSEMGSSSNRKDFNGTLHGHGHSIYNLYCDRGNYFQAGFFGSICGATIDSLAFINPTCKGKGMIGVIAGAAVVGGNDVLNAVMIVNARIIGQSSGNNIGCFVGATYNLSSNNLTATNCGATGYVYGSYPGGFGGNCEHSTYTNCYFNGTIVPTGSNHGGLSAWLGTFNNCYSNRSVSGTGDNGTYKDDTYMQSAAFISDLGTAFKEDCAINNGYPILDWMICGVPVNGDLEICYGESTTLEAYGYDSYVWSTGATTAAITVSPTTTTDYYVTGTKNNGTVVTDTITVTVYPQAVITAEAVASSDGLVHGTVTLSASTIPCGSTQTVTMTVTPDAYWHISKVVQDGVILREDDPTDGSVVTITIDPQGTLANVKVYFDNKYDITVTQQLNDGSSLNLSALVNPWGENGIYAATAGTDVTYTFTGTARYHIMDVMIDGASYGVMDSYTFNTVNATHDILITYADSCGIYTLPFAENFDTYTYNSFPECWYRSGTYPYVSTTASSSPNGFYFYTSSSNSCYVVLPKVADIYAVNALMVSYKSRTSSTSNYFQIGVMTDPENINTFVPVASTPETATNTWTNHEVYLSDYVGQGEYIAIRLSGSTYASGYLDDIVVDFAPSCSHVNNLQVNNIYGTNATLTWEPNQVGIADNYVIEVTENSTQTVHTYTTTGTTFALMNLNEQSSYTVTVQADCGNGDISAAETVSFTTPCIAPVEAVNNSYPTSTYSTEGNHFPVSNHYLNSFTEQIYYASELGNTSAEFSSISFQYNISTVIDRTIDIYLAHTSDMGFTANVWATPLDNYVHVYHGPVSFNYNGVDRWVDIPFDTNFYYNGSDNLLLIVNDITGSAYNNSNAKFYTINTDGNRSQCEYNNTEGQNWSINSLPTTGKLHTQINNIKLSACESVTCIAPNTLTASDVDASSASINWINPNTSTANCEISYKAESDTVWISIANITAPYVLTGLTANTQYDVRVRALCSSTDMSNWSEQTLSFRTECDAINTLPYVQNFDNDTYGSTNDLFVYCWDKLSNNADYMPYVYAASTANTQPNVLRFRDGASVVSYAIMPRIDASLSINQLQLSFLVRNTSTSSPVLFEVGVMTDKTDANSFQSVAVVPNCYDESMCLVELPLSTYQGNGQYIAFRASNGDGGHNIRIDNVNLDYIPTCPHPLNFAASNITSTSVQLDWEETGSATSWIVEYGPTGFTPGTGNVEVAHSETTTLSNLSPNTLYDVYVQADCGNETSTTVKVSFRTDCGELNSFPYVENFDHESGSTSTSVSTNNLPPCWSNYNTGSSTTYSGYPMVYNYSTYAHSGSNSMRFYAYSTSGTYSDQIAILPPVDTISYPINSLQLTFQTRKYSTSYTGKLVVGVMSNPTDKNTFVPVDTVEAAGTTYEEFTVYFNNFTGYGNYVAIMGPQPSSSYNAAYVDDVVLDVIPSCVRPIDVTLIGSTSSSITIGWTEMGTATSWLVEYGPTGFTPGTGTVEVASSNPYTISNLDANTAYDVYVQSDCSIEVSTPTLATFRTACGAITNLPYTEDFESGLVSINSTEYYISCWSRYASDPAHYVYIPSNNYAHSGTHFLDFHWTSNCYNIAISPEIDASIDMSTLMVNFWASRSGSSGLLEVGIMDDPYADSTFFPIDSIDLSASSTYQMTEQIVGFANYTGNGHYVAFRVSNAVGCGFYLDDVTIDVAPLCSPVSDLEVSEITGTSAIISWNAGPLGTITDYTLEYSEAGQNNWTTIPSITTTSFLLGGLDPSSYYDVRVISNCNDGSQGDVITLDFRTSCLVGGDVTIGEGTNTNNYLPSYNYYKNSLTEQLYLQTELGNANTFSSISFQCATANATSRSWAIYLMPTTQTSLTGFVNTGTTAVKVFDGNVNIQTGWFTVQFTTPFQYDGSSNLILIVDDNTGSYVTGNSYYTHSASNMARRIYSDATNYDPATATTYTATAENYRNNVIFGGECDTTTTCVAPHITLSTTTSTSITVDWVPGYLESAWELEYKPEADTVWLSMGSLTGNSTVVSGLNSNTMYNIRMRSVCGAGDYSYWAYLSARTDCDMISVLPFSENFDNMSGATSTSVSTNNLPTCWYYYNTGTTSTYSGYPIVYNSSTYAHSGSNAMRFYNYSTVGSYSDQIAILPPVNTAIYPLSALQLTFQTRKYSTSYTGKLVVGVMTNPSDRSTFVPVDTVEAVDAAYEEISVYFLNYNGNGNYIAIMGPQPTSSYNAAYVDDIVLDLIPSCPKPIDVTLTASTSSSITLGWTELGSASSWEIEYGLAGFTQGTGTVVNTTTNPHTITGLNASTAYDVYVRSACSATDFSNWTGPKSLRTDCGAITTLPYFENFDGATIDYNGHTYLECWDAVQSDNAHYAYIGTGSTYAHSGSQYMDFHYTPNCYDIAILPTLDTSINISDLTLDFWLRKQTYNTNSITFEIGVMSDRFDANTFVSLGTVDVQTTNTYEHITYPLTQYTGTGRNIAFRVSNGNNVTYYVDDLTIDYSPTCIQPQNVTASNVTYSTADIAWTEMGTATSWEIEYGVQGFAHGSGNIVTATTNPFTLTNLTSNTNYDVYVRSVCSATDQSYWSATPTNFTTPIYEEPCDVPTDLVASNVSQTSAVISWTAGGDETAWNLEYKTAAGLNWEPSISVSGNPTHTLSNLTANTQYFVRVQAVCDFGSVSDWSLPIPFQTLEEGVETCDAPTNLHQTDIQNHEISIAWDQASTDVDNWTVNFRKQGTTNWTSFTATATQYTITGLEGLTSYEIEVLANCSNGLTSDPSNRITVETTNVGIEDFDLNSSVSLFPNPTNDLVKVECSETMMENISIYDVYGKLINQFNVNDTYTTLDVTKFANGIYFVRITTENGVVTKRLVKE